MSSILQRRRGLNSAIGVNAGVELHRIQEQRCISSVDENALEHGLVWWVRLGSDRPWAGRRFGTGSDPQAGRRRHPGQSAGP
jgi:hypothetical protein